MNNRLEDRIRDYLAENLEILEGKLEFIQKEYLLNSSNGASGKIDIIARDMYGQIVVIEIKRSDQTARQALHEIHKYIALFRIKQGLDELKIRLLIVSTEWHELLVPLSEFAKITKYSVEGFKINALTDGIITSAEKVDLISNEIKAVQISRMQSVYLFSDKRKRNKQEQKLIEAIGKAHVEDYVVFNCDYSGGNQAVIYPYALYFCFSSPFRNLPANEIETIKQKIEWDDTLDDLEENFLCAINKEIKKIGCDDIEVGYPEKFLQVCNSWKVSVSVRSGRFGKAHSILADEELIRMAQFSEGGSNYYLAMVSSPRFKTAWRQLEKNIGVVLMGYPQWQKIIPQVLAEIKLNAKNATVSLYVYSPSNLLMSLYFIAREKDLSKCPFFEIVVEDKVKKTIRVINGFLTWSGQKIDDIPRIMMMKIFKNIDTWMMANHFGETFKYEEKAIKLHKLHAVVTEWRLKRNQEMGPNELITRKNKIAMCKFNQKKHKSITEFALSQNRYLQALKKYLNTKI